jgi:hypothetical protein
MNNDDRYLDAIAYETLRVRPVVMDVARVLDQPVTIGGYELPAGTTVMPSIYLVHLDGRHPKSQAHSVLSASWRLIPNRPRGCPLGEAGDAAPAQHSRCSRYGQVLQVVLARRTLRAPSDSSERLVLRGITSHLTTTRSSNYLGSATTSSPLLVKRHPPTGKSRITLRIEPGWLH